MGKKLFASLFCFAMLLWTSPAFAYADTAPYFTFQLDAVTAAPDGLVKIKINANQMPDTAAGFRMKIDYDDELLTFVRTETSSQIKTGTMMTNSDSNPIVSVYVCNVDQKAAPTLSGNIISFVFRVRSDVPKKQTAIGVHIDQVCNFEAKQLNLNYDDDLTLNIDPGLTAPSTAYLTSLVPLTGRLTPEFSADVLEYEMTVPEDVKTVEFEAAAGSGGSVKINRKTLGKAGSDTAILITVTSADKKSKTQYAVTVHRQEAQEDTVTGTDSAETGTKTTTAGAVKSTAQSGKGGNSAAAGDGATKSISASAGGAVVPEHQITPQAAPAFAPSNAAVSGNRNVYIVGNQMPGYVVVLLAAVALVQLGAIFAPWLNNAHPKKKE